MNRAIPALLFLVSISAHAVWEEKAVPGELKSFVEPQNFAIEYETADLNGDGLADYVLVLQRQKKGSNEEALEDGERSLLLIIRQRDGSLKLAKTNRKVVFCSQCGGVFGDPFESLEAGPKTFTVNHYGGSAWRWRNSFKFNYSRRDDTWQLVRVETLSFHAADPDRTMKEKIYTPPKHFGKIDIADFDPDDFTGMGAR